MKRFYVAVFINLHDLEVRFTFSKAKSSTTAMKKAITEHCSDSALKEKLLSITSLTLLREALDESKIIVEAMPIPIQKQS